MEQTEGPERNVKMSEASEKKSRARNRTKEAASCKARRDKLKARTAEELLDAQKAKYGVVDVATAQKTCSRCKLQQPLLTAFDVDKCQLDGRKPTCKVCRVGIRQANSTKRKQRPQDEIEESRAKKIKIVNGVQMKACVGCHQQLDIATSFSSDKTTVTGLRTLCKTCESKQPKRNPSKKYRQKMSARTDDEILEAQKAKYGELTTARKKCWACREDKPLSEFNVDKGMPDGFQAGCKPCGAKKRQELRVKCAQRSVEEVESVRAKELKTVDGVLLKRCGHCQLELDALVCFAPSATTPTGLSDRCKSCQRKRGREEHDRASALRAELKAGKTCEECGEADPEVLEFAHRDRAEKLRNKHGRPINITGMRNLTTIIEEAKKTRFLCRFCHRLETKRENDVLTQKGTPQRLSQAQKRAIEYVDSIKLEVRVFCVDCRRPVTKDTLQAFDFDHVVEETKFSTISIMVHSGHAIDSINVELAKCELRCANCHLRRTKQRATIMRTKQDAESTPAQSNVA